MILAEGIAAGFFTRRAQRGGHERWLKVQHECHRAFLFLSGRSHAARMPIPALHLLPQQPARSPATWLASI